MNFKLIILFMYFIVILCMFLKNELFQIKYGNTGAC